MKSPPDISLHKTVISEKQRKEYCEDSLVRGFAWDATHFSLRKSFSYTLRSFTRQYTFLLDDRDMPYHVFESQVMAFNISMSYLTYSHHSTFNVLFLQSESYSWVDIAINLQSISERRNVFSDAVFVNELVFGQMLFNKLSFPEFEMVVLILNKTTTDKEAIKLKSFLLTVFNSEYSNTRDIVSIQQLSLLWEAEIELTNQNPDYTIRIPGRLNVMDVENLNRNNVSFNVIWLSSKYNKFKNFFLSQNNPRRTYFFPRNITVGLWNLKFPWRIYLYSATMMSFAFHTNYFKLKKHHYLVFHFQFHKICEDPCFHIIFDSLMTTSWIEADKMCRHAGGTLPLIRSRGEPDELTSLLKFGKKITSYWIPIYWLCKFLFFLLDGMGVLESA